MYRLIWVFADYTGLNVGFVVCLLLSASVISSLCMSMLNRILIMWSKHAYHRTKQLSCHMSAGPTPELSWRWLFALSQRLLCSNVRQCDGLVSVKMSRNVRKQTVWHLPSLKKLKSVCASQSSYVHMKKLCILGYPKYAQWRFRSACANARMIWIFVGRTRPNVSDVKCRSNWNEHLYTITVTYIPFKVRQKKKTTMIKIMSRCYGKRTFWRAPNVESASESSLSAWRKFASLPIQNASSEDSDQTAQMHRLIWICAERTCPKVQFLTLRLTFWRSAIKLKYMRTCNLTRICNLK